MKGVEVTRVAFTKHTRRAGISKQKGLVAKMGARLCPRQRTCEPCLRTCGSVGRNGVQGVFRGRGNGQKMVE